MGKKIKIIDLFSGPGGLGEGFASYINEKKSHPFKILTSIEKDKNAHQTLLLRAFYRQFNGSVPEEYYQFLRGELGTNPEEFLYSNSLFKNEYQSALNEALNLELGKDNELIQAKIKAALGDDECVLIGGPPCQAYSVAGVARNKANKSYDPKYDERNFLYREYLQIIAQFQPCVFVMENVKGMLSAKVNGENIFQKIFSDLQNPCKASQNQPVESRKSHSYKILSLSVPHSPEQALKPKEHIIYSEKYGIPQRRHRVILLGIREDYFDPNRCYTLNESGQDVCVNDVIADLPKLRSGLSKVENTDLNWAKVIQKSSKQIVKAIRKTCPTHLVDAYEKYAVSINSPISGQGSKYSLRRDSRLSNSKLRKWFYDPHLGDFVCNHETRGHLEADLQRYLFCSVWGETSKELGWANRTPKSQNFPKCLYPNHKNFETGKFADRFRVQVWDIPATTITSHISKDGHYYIHPDPAQCRSLTVREAARIQTFPDNYLFLGNRTSQYVQVGNAVPPLLANQIASVVYGLVNKEFDL